MNSPRSKGWAILICLCLLVLLGLTGGHEFRALQEFEMAQKQTSIEVAHD